MQTRQNDSTLVRTWILNFANIWGLHGHEKGNFMPSSSILMVHASMVHKAKMEERNFEKDI